MNPIVTWYRNPARAVSLVPLVCAVFVLLLLRNTGTYPGIFADEYYYSVFARLVPPAEAWVPSYLYYAIFSKTSACGDGFLECVRVLNVLLFTGASPFIYALARRVMQARGAAIVTGLAMLAPFNLYTAYFMPEAMYYFAFWFFTWVLYRFVDKGSLLVLATAGALLGLTAMVKVHALFLLPPLSVFLVYTAYTRREQRNWLLQALIYLVVALGAAMAARFGVGYLLAGEAGLSLLGPWYGTQSKSGKPPLEMIVLALQNLRGHLLGMALLFALPIAAMLLHACSGAARREGGRILNSLMVYAFLMLGAMICVTALFSASVVGGGPNETIERLHMRYYDFLFPLLLLIAGAGIGQATQRARLFAALVPGALVIYACVCLMSDFRPVFVDTPELWPIKTPALCVLFGLLAIGTLVLWVRDADNGKRAFLLVLTPLLTIVSAAALFTIVRDNILGDPYAKAGQFVKNHLLKGEMDKLTVIGVEQGSVFRTKFFLDNFTAGMLILPEGEAFNVGQLGKQKDWVLVIGKHPAPPEMIAQNADRGFVLYKFERGDLLAGAIDFSDRDLGFKSVSGLSGPEPWGRWTDGKQVLFELARPMPRKLTLYLSARAIGANINAPVTVRIGEQVQTIKLLETTTAATLHFDTSGAETRIELEVPHPVAASSLGNNKQDPRMIGLGLIRMELAERKP